MLIKSITLSDASLVYDKGDYPKAIYVNRQLDKTKRKELSLYEDKILKQPKDLLNKTEEESDEDSRDYSDRKKD